ncbi:hypothetical protein [Bdellovibrio sp. ArHS]|uniref:hypothetical protein n=1 Tax=Bdellovibrio sp. ArHS TaxID=1569284 RepID=UPI0025C38DC3|nr:hypothetical protein [Bdellovibrio sp. ArHS]
MKHFARATFLLLGLFTNVVLAQDHVPLHDGNQKISSADRIAYILINSLPDSGVKKGLQRYYEILNPRAYEGDAEVAYNNTGLSLYFDQQFRHNACFADKALRFYHNIKTTTKSTQKTNPEDLRHSRTSLGDTAGSSRPDLPAGWLFQKALTFTKGNANAALSLIGLCGHDDIRQGSYFNEEAEDKLLKEGFTYDDLYRIPEVAGEEETFCPTREADFYIARSLAKKADISDSLKKRILEVQYPGKKAVQIASKNYHVLGAAFMTCQMIEAGMNPYLAIQVETTAANLYRGIRLCQNIEEPARMFWKLQKMPEILRRPFAYTFEEAVVRKTLDRGLNKECTMKKIETDPLCELLYKVGSGFDLTSPRAQERAKAALEKYLDMMIPSGVYTSWNITGQIAGISIPCTRDQLFGPHPFMKWLVSQAHLPLNICGKGLSLESCRKALNTLRTWEVDFDWTVSQHLAGAQFAARVCKPLPEGQTSFQAFCN